MFMKRRIIICLCALAVCVSSSAQKHGIGFFASPKGFGLEYEWDGPADRQYFHSLTLYSDIYGVLNERTQHPGIKMNFSRLYHVDFIPGRESSFLLYVGPGLTAGYVHDFEKEYWQNPYSHLQKKAGAVFALSGTFGCHILFNRSIMFDLSISLAAGMHIRDDGGTTKLSLYKNGLVQTLYPQFTFFALF